MMDEWQYTRRTTSASVPLSPNQARFLERSRSAQRFVTQKFEERELRCQIDVNNRVVHVASESGVEPEFVSRELGTLIVEHTLEADPYQAVLFDNVPDGGVKTLPGNAVVIRDGSKLKVVGLSNDVSKFTIDMSTADLLGVAGNQTKDEPEKKETPVIISVPMSNEIYSYLCSYKRNVIRTLGNNDVVVEFVDSVGRFQNAVKMTGPQSTVTLCEESILRLLQGVSTYKSLFGIPSGLPAYAVAKLVKDIASRNKCTSQIAYVSPNGVVNDDIQGAERLDRLGEGPYVKLVANKLQSQEAGVIVNNSHRNLNLGVGTVSASLLKSCGEKVQDELKQNYPKGIENGEYAVSSSGRMDTCQEIYHGALPASKGLDALPIELCYKNMIKLVYNCLRQASNSGHVTIAFPALGTGALAYPAEDVAYLMYKAVRLFLQHCYHTTLELIYFVLHPSAPREMKQIFLAHHISQTVDTLLVDALCLEEAQVSGKLVSEVLFRVGPTLVKVVNADLYKMCPKSCFELVLWNQSGIQDLPVTKTAMDTDSTTSRTVIHSYIEKENGKDLDRAVKRGLKRGMKEDKPRHMLALSVPSLDLRLRRDIASTTVSILQGVKDSKDSVLVFAVFIPDRDHFSAFVTAARGIYTSEKPSVGLANLVDLNDDQIRKDLLLEETGKQVLLTVTSDSEQVNRKVAREIQKALHSND